MEIANPKVCGIDLGPVVLFGLIHQFGKDSVERLQTASPDEAVVDRLVWALSLGWVTPHKAFHDGVNDV